MAEDKVIKARFVYLDILRLIAMLSVILMHATSKVLQYSELGKQTYTFHFLNVMHAVTSFAVPIFIMISGALMLGRQLSVQKIIKKIFHFICVYLFWSFLYSVILIESKYIGGYTFKGVIVNTLLDTIGGWFHFWYIFMICGLYLTIPILDRFILHITKDVAKYYVGCCILICVIFPIIGFVPHLNKFLHDFDVGFFGKFVFFFIAGYGLSKIDTQKYQTAASITFFTMLVVTVVGTIVLNVVGSKYEGFLTDYCSVNMFLMTISLFIVVKNRFQNCNSSSKAAMITTDFANASFGVYLIHELILELLARSWSFNNEFWDYCILVTIGTAISFAISLVMRKIKLTRSLVS